MKTAGIIAEYNPFHNGHKYHVEETKKQTGADYCIVAMSGNFVQRGAPAIIDKYARAKSALAEGADLVIQIPPVYSLSSAEFYAKGSISLLESTGLINYLSFGSEAGTLEKLEKIAGILVEEPEKYKKLLHEYRDDLYCSAQVSWDDGLIDAIGATEDDHDHIKPFHEICDDLSVLIEKVNAEAKKQIGEANKKDKKALEQKCEKKVTALRTILDTAKEADWLYEKFGEGEYRDIPGLCKAATLAEIEEKGWSLTPGAYVGVPPTADDGVDFAARMKEIHAELLRLQAESNDLMAAISKNMEEMGV